MPIFRAPAIALALVLIVWAVAFPYIHVISVDAVAIGSVLCILGASITAAILSIGKGDGK